jgi:ethanolamine utilization protein EutN
MNLARIMGHAVATVKHPSLTGWRLLLAQILTPAGQADGEPVLVIDSLGAAVGSLVVLSSDGAMAREMVKAKNSPARWLVLGICDA